MCIVNCELWIVIMNCVIQLRLVLTLLALSPILPFSHSPFLPLVSREQCYDLYLRFNPNAFSTSFSAKGTRPSPIAISQPFRSSI